jgi:hypothetical protein
MRVFAEQAFDLVGSDQKVWARIYEPILEPDGTAWACFAEIDEPLSWYAPAYGASGFQAVTLALKLLSMWLYSSEEYARKEIGWKGQFGGNLGLPAIHQHLDAAPYPF